MDSPHTLLQAVRVPGNVVVDHQMAELQIDAFTGSFCSYHYLGFILEDALCLYPIFQSHTTVDGVHAVPPGSQLLLDILQGIS